MKKIHYIYVCLGALLTAVLPAKAASEAEFVKIEKNYTLNADGSQEMRVYKELTLITYAAISMYGETFIVYNPVYQELKIHESYTRQQDGTIVKTPDNAFVESLPFAAANAPAYNGLKEMVVVHTGLELGATIYLDYTVTTRSGYLPELDICTQIEEYSPIKEYTFSVVVPENKPLNYTIANGDLTPAVDKANGKQVVTWTQKDVPAFYPVGSHSAMAGNVRVILANTYASATGALDVIRTQFTASEDKEVAALAQKLVEGKADDEREQVLKAYVEGLGSCRLTLGDTGYRLRPATEVIRTAYGTDAEKLNLLIGLLKTAGLPAEAKAAYAVKADKNCLGLSAITELFIKSPSVAGMQDYQPVLTLEGKDIVLDAPEPITKTDTLKVDAEMGKAVAGGYRMVALPRVDTHLDAGTSECTANLLLPRKVDETHTSVIVLPADLQLCAPQGNKELANAVGQLKITVDTAGENPVLVRSLKLEKQLVTPADYADYRALIAEWNDTNNNVILLKAR